MLSLWEIIKESACKFGGSKVVRITIEIIVDLFYNIVDTIERNLRNVAIIIRTGLPYLMWYIGVYLYEDRGEFTIGGEIFIPVIVYTITYYISQYANRIGKGERIPVPTERFTEKGSEEGEYNIEQSRIEEMILYMADLENWLQRKGLLKK